MIGKLTGRFDGSTAEGSALLDVGGVGYLLRVPQSVLERLATHGSHVSLYVYTAVREDAIDLYGFSTEEELGFFKQLMSVSGIGPKSALSILNTAEVSVLKRSIAKGDAAALTKIFGIGKKSAERIVVELREKIVFTITEGPASALEAHDGDVLEALMALGYSASEGRKALKEVGDVEGTKERIAAALRYLGREPQAV